VSIDLIGEMGDSEFSFYLSHVYSGKIRPGKNRISMGKEQWFWFLEIFLTAKDEKKKK
jgi:hypothetical protein